MSTRTKITLVTLLTFLAAALLALGNPEPQAGFVPSEKIPPGAEIAFPVDI